MPKQDEPNLTSAPKENRAGFFLREERGLFHLLGFAESTLCVVAEMEEEEEEEERATRPNQSSTHPSACRVLVG